MFDSEVLADGGQLGVVPKSVGPTLDVAPYPGGLSLDDVDDAYESSAWRLSDTTRTVQAAHDVGDGGHAKTAQSRWKSPAAVFGNTRVSTRSARRLYKNRGGKSRNFLGRKEQHDHEHGRKSGGGGGGSGGAKSNTGAQQKGREMKKKT